MGFRAKDFVCRACDLQFMAPKLGVNSNQEIYGRPKNPKP